MGADICDESLEQVLAAPFKGDRLCFDGEKWRVARRNGWHYQVPDPHPTAPPAVPQTDEHNGHRET